MIRTLKAAALTAALSAAALAGTPATAFAAESHGRPIAAHGPVLDRGHDNGRGLSLGRDGGAILDRGHDNGRGLSLGRDGGAIVDRGHDNGRVLDRSHDNSRVLDRSHDNSRVLDRDRDDRRGVVVDRRVRRLDRTVVVEVSSSSGPLLLRSQHAGSDWPRTLHVGGSTVRVRANEYVDYRALHVSGVVQIQINGNQTRCAAQGHLRCEVVGSSLVRVHRV